jgi:hypothetical protein
MFGVVVSQILLAQAPKNVELALFNAVSDPVELHVDGARLVLFNIVVRNAAGC